MEIFQRLPNLVKSGKMVGNGNFKYSFQNFYSIFIPHIQNKNNNKIPVKNIRAKLYGIKFGFKFGN